MSNMDWKWWEGASPAGTVAYTFDIDLGRSGNSGSLGEIASVSPPHPRPRINPGAETTQRPAASGLSE